MAPTIAAPNLPAEQALQSSAFSSPRTLPYVPLGQLAQTGALATGDDEEETDEGAEYMPLLQTDGIQLA